MDHPDTRLLARYALGEVTDDSELGALEDHLMECEQCRRRAVAVDLIGSTPAGRASEVLLHIASDESRPLCGVDSPHVISTGLLSGLDANILCTSCVAAMRGENARFVN